MPIILLPPSWRSFCSSKRFFSVSISSSQPIFSILAFSSGVSSSSSFLLQPLERDVLGEVGQHLDALEVGGEGAVELVEVGLVLDQRGAREVVEVVDVGAFVVRRSRRP